MEEQIMKYFILLMTKKIIRIKNIYFNYTTLFLFPELMSFKL